MTCSTTVVHITIVSQNYKKDNDNRINGKMVILMLFSSIYSLPTLIILKNIIFNQLRELMKTNKKHNM